MNLDFVDQFIHTRTRLRLLLAVLLVYAAAMPGPPALLLAETIPVRRTEGLMHGFLVLRSLDDKALADSQLTQNAQGDRVTNRLTFPFKTSVFSQRDTHVWVLGGEAPAFVTGNKRRFYA